LNNYYVEVDRDRKLALLHVSGDLEGERTLPRCGKFSGPPEVSPNSRSLSISVTRLSLSACRSAANAGQACGPVAKMAARDPACGKFPWTNLTRAMSLSAGRSPSGLGANVIEAPAGAPVLVDDEVALGRGK
jgi:hypothetical protein